MEENPVTQPYPDGETLGEIIGGCLDPHEDGVVYELRRISPKSVIIYSFEETPEHVVALKSVTCGPDLHSAEHMKGMRS